MPNIERLQTLVSFLETDVPAGRFDMSLWGRDADNGFCGCAIGWASRCPALVQQGLRLISDRTHWVTTYYPSCDGGMGLTAARLLFDLTHDEAAYLFGSCTRTLAEEIALLKEVIKQHTPEPEESSLQPELAEV